jgi:isopentenyl-diphosphate delta-isomerase
MDSSESLVLLVDGDDRLLGTAPKLDVHRDGRLHRAYSVFVFDGEGRLLLQRRSEAKYHSAGLWANTCCSHPRPGEDTAAAAHARLLLEMGIACPLEHVFHFVYNERVGDGMIEHELDHVFVGTCDGDPTPDRTEVSEWRWAPIAEVSADLRARPEAYSAWLGIALRELEARGFLERGA